MSSRICFENELELCSYLDGEIFGARGAALEDHIIICGRCSDQFLAWKQLKNLVRGSFSNDKAPTYIKERISFIIRSFAGRDSVEPREKIPENNQRPSDYPRSRAGHFQPGDIEYPISATPPVQNKAVNGKMGETDQHIDGH